MITREEADSLFAALRMTVHENEPARQAVDWLREFHVEREKGIDFVGDPLVFAEKLSEASSWKWKAEMLYHSIYAYGIGGILGSGYLIKELEQWPMLARNDMNIEEAINNLRKKK